MLAGAGGYGLRANRGQNAGTNLRLELQLATGRIARLHGAQKMFGATSAPCAPASAIVVSTAMKPPNAKANATHLA